MESKNCIKVEQKIHKEEDRYFFKYGFNLDANIVIKSIKDSKYSSTHKAWHIPSDKSLLKQVYLKLKSKFDFDFSTIKKEETKPYFDAPVVITETKYIRGDAKKQHLSLAPLTEENHYKVEQFKKWMLSKRYSTSTIGTYIESLRVFLKYYHFKKIDEIDNTDLINFNTHYILEQGLSPSFQNQIINAVKLFFRSIENKKLDVEMIYRPRREKVLPNVLSKEEVKHILNSLNNIKHKTMLSLIYSCGLRCGELLKLKPGDIDSKRKLILVKQAKGKKDRIVPLSNKILEMLRQYWLVHEPKNFLFEGQKAGEMYDVRSLQQVLKQAVYKAGIKKPVTLHWLRHSYATHLLENGTDLRYIQEILGHSRSTTTEIYTHVSTKGIQNVVSPFDHL